MNGPLFRVADVFSIRGRGVVIVATVARDDLKLRVGDPIELVGADGFRRRTEVRVIEMPMVPAGACPPFVFLVGTEVEKADVEVGAEVWRVEPEPSAN